MSIKWIDGDSYGNVSMISDLSHFMYYKSVQSTMKHFVNRILNSRVAMIHNYLLYNYVDSIRLEYI